MQEFLLVKNSFKNSSYKKHFHSTYSISLITDGECNFSVDNKRYTASKGDVRVINPYELHEIKSSSWEHKNLVLSAFAVRRIAKEFKKSKIYFQTLIRDEKLVLGLENFYDKKDVKVDEILEYMLQKYSYQDSDKEALHVDKEQLQKAISYIYQNANNCAINLDEIAFYAGFSKYHFLREFKKEFGLTPYQYIQNIKINNSRRMLSTDISLSQIAQECGFFDQSHLIKTYKKFFGHTPSKVRKQQ